MQDVKETVRRHWNRRAADFDASASHGLVTPAQARAWRALLGGIAGAGPVDVLDVGCGTGFLALLLAEQGHRVTAVDLAEEMLSRARAKAAERGLSVRFERGDVENLACAGASFDLVVERHLLWTLPHPDAALDCWRRILRPGGRLVLIEGAWSRRDRKDEYEAIRDRLPLYGGRPQEELAALVRANGFGPVEARPLMEPELWAGAPAHPRYLILATVRPFKPSSRAS